MPASTWFGASLCPVHGGAGTGHHLSLKPPLAMVLMPSMVKPTWAKALPQAGCSWVDCTCANETMSLCHATPRGAAGLTNFDKCHQAGTEFKREEKQWIMQKRDSGFLPLIVDYRMGPETTLVDWPMVGETSAIEWVHRALQGGCQRLGDVAVDLSKIVAGAWSTGGQLALSLTPAASQARGARGPVRQSNERVLHIA